MSILNRPGWTNRQLLNEARVARHASSLDLSLIQKQLADKKIGIPYRDARRFLYDFLRDNGIVEGDTPMAAKDINAIVGELVTNGKITPELSTKWSEYVADSSNLQKFIGMTRSIRGRLATDASENVPLTPEQIAAKAAEQKQLRKVVKTGDIGESDTLSTETQFKLHKSMLTGKLSKLRPALIEYILDNLADDEFEAEDLADDALEFVGAKLSSDNVQTQEDISNTLDKVAEFGNSADAFLATELMKTFQVEDSEELHAHLSNEPKLSECCDARPVMELDEDDFGRCSKCKEIAHFSVIEDDKNLLDKVSSKFTGPEVRRDSREEYSMPPSLESVKLSSTKQNQLLKENYINNLKHKAKTENRYFGHGFYGL
jgi:antitoxin component of MazEF toxin-antitoxin module